MGWSDHASANRIWSGKTSSTFQVFLCMSMCLCVYTCLLVLLKFGSQILHFIWLRYLSICSHFHPTVTKNYRTACWSTLSTFIQWQENLPKKHLFFHFHCHSSAWIAGSSILRVLKCSAFRRAEEKSTMFMITFDGKFGWELLKSHLNPILY